MSPFICILTVGKFNSYKIPLKTLPEGINSFEYQLDNGFFEETDSSEVKAGAVSVFVTVKKTAGVFELNVKLDGVVSVPCDRCLDDMTQPIAYEGKFFVRFSDDFSQETDELIVIPERESEINIAWYLYEFVALSIPPKHTHAAGECNKEMAEKLGKYLIVNDENDGFSSLSEDEDADHAQKTGENRIEIDPRWSKLKDIIANN